MTIGKGEPWGSAVARPDGLRICSSDRDLARAVAAGATDPLSVSAGDLHRSLGSPPVRAEVLALPVDVLEVDVDGEDHLAIAHVVLRRSWWRGPIVAALNVDHLGPWNAAPRAHPNDGRFDVLEVDPAMTTRQRWQARTRLPNGTHVPHPSIATRTATDGTWTFERPVGVWLDGERVATASIVTIRIRPDAVTILV